MSNKPGLAHLVLCSLFSVPCSLFLVLCSLFDFASLVDNGNLLAMWTITATAAIVAVVVVLTYFLVGPYRSPAAHMSAPPEDHGHGTH